MKKFVIVLVCLVIGFTTYSQTESNNFELKYDCGYSATPADITSTNDVLDTSRLGEANFYKVGGAIYLNCGLGAEFNYFFGNSYFDTIAGGGNNYSVGLYFRRIIMGPGNLFDDGFNSAFMIGAGYINSERVDQIEYINLSDVSRMWRREKTSQGFYVNGKFDIFKDAPEFIDFYGISVSGSIKNSVRSVLCESVDDKVVKGKWHKEDSVPVVSLGLEVKPIIFPLSSKMGLSLITGLSYGNFNSYNTYDPGVRLSAGLSLDGFSRFGECVRVIYTCAPRDSYLSNEVSLRLDLIQTCRTLFGR